MNYALIDTANTFFRARHVASRNSTLDEKIGMALHLTLASVNQAVRKYGIDHVVFCLEGRSFRKDLYAPYKKNRVVDAQSVTETEKEESEMFWETYAKFTQYITEKTNVSVLRHECMRGDASDNVFSAYPGVREKGTKNKVGLMEAYADRTKQGFSWNNLMLQRWQDHDGVEHRVREDYERNRTLIDLKAQPQDIKDAVDTRIKESVRVDTIPQVGIHFMKFCGKYELTKISEQAEIYAKWLNNPYKGTLHESHAT